MTRNFFPNFQGAFAMLTIYIHRLYLKRNRRNVPWCWIARMHFRWATSYLLPFAYSLFVERNSWTTLECCCPNLCGHHPQLSPAPLSVLLSAVTGTCGVTTQRSRQRVRTHSHWIAKSHNGISSKTTWRVRFVSLVWWSNILLKQQNCLPQPKRMLSGAIAHTYVCSALTGPTRNNP